jgi:hypothetical protein
MLPRPMSSGRTRLSIPQVKCFLLFLSPHRTKTARGHAIGISHNLITRVELPMRPGYNARGKQSQMSNPRTESRAERIQRRSGSCGSSQCIHVLPSLTSIATCVMRSIIAGSFSLLLLARFTHCCSDSELAGCKDGNLVMVESM